MKKKLFALCLSIAMLGAFCSCAMADDGNQTEKDSETTYVESEIEEDSEIAASESELRLVQSVVKDYLEANSGVSEDFNDIVSDITEAYGISAEQAESLYNIIAEQIVTEYLADYDMKPEDFVWPSTDYNDDEYAAWSYLEEMISIKLIYLQSNLDQEPDIIEDYAALEQKSIDLMNCIYKAIIKWYDENGSILPYSMMWQKYLPGNVTVDRLCNIIDRK